MGASPSNAGWHRVVGVILSPQWPTPKKQILITQGIAEEKALKRGMEENSKEFVEKDAEDYANT